MNVVSPSNDSEAISTLPESVAENRNSMPESKANPVTRPCWWSTCAPRGHILYGANSLYSASPFPKNVR